MSETDWERLSAGTGIAAVVLLALAAFLPGTPPAADDSIRQVRAFFVDNRTAILVQSILFGVGAASLLWFVGALRSYLRRSEGSTGRLSATAYAGGLVVVSLAFVVGFITLGLAYRVASDADDALVRALFDMVTVGGVLFGFPVAVLIAAASLVAQRTGAMSRGVMGLGGIAVMANLAGTSQIFFDSGAWAPGGSAAFIPFALALLWLLAASLTMISRLRRSLQSPGSQA